MNKNYVSIFFKTFGKAMQNDLEYSDIKKDVLNELNRKLND